MKILLPSLSALAISIVASTASASDLGLAPASFDWQGIYFGANLGAGINQSNLSDRYSYRGTGTIPAQTSGQIEQMGMSFDPTDAAFTGGISTGYNWQYSSIVLGLEADINYFDSNSHKSRNVSGIVNSIFANDATSANQRLEASSEWFGTIRGRLGYAMDNLLFYGTGGFAYGYASASSEFRASSGPEFLNWNGSDNGWSFGWTLGGGFEYGLDRWTVGLEYLYVDLGSYEWQSDGDVNLTDVGSEATWQDVQGRGSMDYAFSLVRGTVKYRF
jgi:outer membrane immunogenic protein